MRALLAWEQGSGMGHVAIFNQIAPFLAARGVEMVAAWGPLDNIHRAHPAIATFLPAPIVMASGAGPWNDELVPTDKNIYSFATNLELTGFGDPQILANSQRVWASLIDLVRPDVIIAEYAPGAIIAAHGRVPIILARYWYSIPAQRDGYLAPYDDEEFRDAETQDRLLATINDVLSQRDVAGFSRLGDLFPDSVCFPAGFPEFDGHRAWRSRPLVPQSFPRITRPARRGEDILVYLYPSHLRNETLAAGLLRLPGRVETPFTGTAKGDRGGTNLARRHS